MCCAKLWFGAPVVLISLILPSLSCRAQDRNGNSERVRGIVPRSSADHYPAHTNHNGVSIGAELLTRKQVSKAFTADLNRCCLVVDVAVYPIQNEPLQISSDSFTLVLIGNETRTKPRSAGVIAAELQEASTPKGGTSTSTSSSIGYGTGTYIDPVTGQPVHGRGVTTSTSVAVSSGSGGGVSPAAAEQDREMKERELREKGLPEAKAAMPVSGYLYFLAPKQKKDTKYRLEYVFNDETVALQLP